MKQQKLVACELRLDNKGNPKFYESKPDGDTTQSQKEWTRPWTKKTLTYSIINGTEDLPEDSKEFLALGLGLTTWGAEVDFTFDRVTPEDNPDIRIEFRTKEEDQKFKDSPNVLAYAYMPGQGRVSGLIVFNEEYLWSMDGEPVNGKTTWNLIHVMIHELGHMLGLLHDENHGTYDVMDPYYNKNMFGLSEHDIFRIRKLYKIRIFSNWKKYLRLKNWLKIRKRRF